MKLNVRCCCQPTKILGTFDMPPEAIQRRYLHVRIRSSITAWFADDQRHPPLRMERIEMRIFNKANGLFELAVYSEDRPVEFWRALREFREGERIE